MNQPLNERNINKILVVIIILLAIATAAILIPAIHSYLSTGALQLESPDDKALLSVSRTGSSAQIIGTGSTSVRLRPGSYLVAASSNGQQVTSVVNIRTSHTTSKSLDPSKQAYIPSPAAIQYQNLDSLIAFGITSAQTENLKQLFFNYKPTAKKVFIDPDSATSAPHNPGDPTYSLTFSGSIDGKSYEAKLSYSDPTNVRLKLYNPKNHKQFYSGDSAKTDK
jgi:hypothetical protein